MSRRPFLVVAVTGGLASGKSSLRRMLEKRGAVAIDADAISRQVTAPGSATLSALVERFGRDILTESGELDRASLARKAFSSRRNLEDLNRITHPPIEKAIRERLDELSRAGYDGVVVIEAALIVEAKMSRDLFDILVAVTCGEGQRRKRLERYSPGRASELLKRLEGQAPEETKARAADYVVRNDGTLDELESRADDLWNWLLRRKERRRGDHPEGQ